MRVPPSSFGADLVHFGRSFGALLRPYGVSGGQLGAPGVSFGAFGAFFVAPVEPWGCLGRFGTALTPLVPFWDNVATLGHTFATILM